MCIRDSSNASSIDELEVIKDMSSKYPEITFIDATTNLENHKNEYIYYKTCLLYTSFFKRW